MLKSFIDANRKLARLVEGFLPQARENIFAAYEKSVAKYMNARDHQLVVDVGGGRSCPFASHRDSSMHTRLIAVDISEDELVENRDVDDRFVADITRNLPFRDGEVDLLVSRSVLEHLVDLNGFFTNANRVLRTGGYMIHLFPSRYAPFSLLNRMIPDRLSKMILHYLIPETKGIGGFHASYKECYYSAIESLLCGCGFEVVEIKLGYYQSPYFSFFSPLFLLSCMYELIVYATGSKNLCAYILVIARKVKEFN